MSAPARRQRRDATPGGGWVDLLAEILFGTPRLPDALCSDRPALFDPAGDREPTARAAERHATALELCAGCNALPACREWLESLPSRQRRLA